MWLVLKTQLLLPGRALEKLQLPWSGPAHRGMVHARAPFLPVSLPMDPLRPRTSTIPPSGPQHPAQCLHMGVGDGRYSSFF